MCEKNWTQAHLKILIIYLIYMYEKDLALNNLQWFIYHKNKPIEFISPAVLSMSYSSYLDRLWNR